MHGIDFCVSMYNQPIDDFRNGLELANNKNNHRFSGNDGRLAIDLLSGAKYFVAKDSNAFRVPHSYTKTDTSLNGFDVYVTKAALPVAFTYDRVISRETYDSLEPIAKQEALLEGCVVEDATGFEVVKPTSAAAVSKYELTLGEDILAEDGMFATSKGNCTITLETTCLPKSETYLRITDLIYDGKSKQETADIFGSADVTGLRARLKDALYKDPFGGRITVKTKLGKRTLTFATPGDGVWTGRDDWCVNLGYSEEPIEKITITLNNRGVYTYRDIEVICQPVEPVLKKATALQGNGAADITFGVDTFSATYTAKQDNSLAFVTLPYSPGWTATVDGQKAEVLQADVGFMAVRLGSAGTHEVVFHYRTPGLVVGGGITLAAIVVFIVVVIRSHRKDDELPPKRSAHMAME